MGRRRRYTHPRKTQLQYIFTCTKAVLRQVFFCGLPIWNRYMEDSAIVGTLCYNLLVGKELSRVEKACHKSRGKVSQTPFVIVVPLSCAPPPPSQVRMGTVSWNKGILYPRTAGATCTSVGERNFVKLAIQGKSPFVTENRRSVTALYHNKRRSTAVEFLKRPSLLSIYHTLRFFPLPLFSPKKAGKSMS